MRNNFFIVLILFTILITLSGCANKQFIKATDVYDEKYGQLLIESIEFNPSMDDEMKKQVIKARTAHRKMINAFKKEYNVK